MAPSVTIVSNAGTSSAAHSSRTTLSEPSSARASSCSGVSVSASIPSRWVS